jgi:hypothetical protein
MISHVITAAEAGLQLPFPSFVFGIIAISTFILLGFVTFSYRDVANRHDHKSSNNSAHH